ncbi:MAG: hypothetical protein ACFE0Q_21020 [Anaerolineae bacterium]
MMKRVVLSVIWLMIAIITTGCMKAVMRFEPDGSGQFEIGLNLSLQDLEEVDGMSDEGGSDDFDAITPLINSDTAIVDEKTGISVSAEERLENGSIWTYIIFEVATIDQWRMIDTATNRIFPSDDDASSDGAPDPSTLATMPTVTLDGSTLRVELTVPSSVDPDIEPEDDPFGIATIMEAFVQVSYEIEMPGTLGEHNGQIDSLTGNPVWLIDLNSEDDLEIVVESMLDD